MQAVHFVPVASLLLLVFSALQGKQAQEDLLPPDCFVLLCRYPVPASLQLMGTLAHHATSPQQLRMQGWLYHLLCFAADAAANSQWRLASASLTSFATCLLRGCELPVSGCVKPYMLCSADFASAWQWDFWKPPG